MADEKGLDLFVVVGEKSGDALAKEVLSPLFKKHSIGGVLGPDLRELGAKEFFPMEALQINGFGSLITKGLSAIQFFFKVRKSILAKKPKAVLLVDNAEFSLLMARSLRKKGFKGKIIQLVAPSIWAWRGSRKKTLETHYDYLLSIFPFEEELFSHSPLPVSYIGHPLVEKILKSDDQPPVEREDLIALFPGSRTKEIKLLLPLQLKVVGKLPDMKVAIGVSSSSKLPLIKSICAKHGVSPDLIPSNERYSLMKRAKVALAKFGTVNLEIAMHSTPTVTHYTLPWIEYFFIAKVFKIFLPHYSIVNILVKRRVFPEYVSFMATEKNLRNEIKNLLEYGRPRAACIEGTLEVQNLMKGQSPAKAGASIIESLL